MLVDCASEPWCCSELKVGKTRADDSWLTCDEASVLAERSAVGIHVALEGMHTVGLSTAAEKEGIVLSGSDKWQLQEHLATLTPPARKERREREIEYGKEVPTKWKPS